MNGLKIGSNRKALAIGTVFLMNLIFFINCSSSSTNNPSPNSPEDTKNSDNSGSWTWSVQLGMTGKSTFASSVSSDSSGNFIVAGRTTGNLMSCAGVSSQCVGSSQGSSDYFVTKHNATGAWQWTRQLGATGKFTTGFGAVDADGSVYVAGTTSADLASCSGVSAGCTGASAGLSDMFLSKYDSNGSWLWTKQLGQSGGNTNVDSMVVSSLGDIYLSGYTNSNISSCAGIPGACSGAAQGFADFFVTKYNSAGTWQWTRQLGQTGKSFSNAFVTADQLGDVIVTGTFNGNINSCSGLSVNCSGSSLGTYDAVIVKYDSNGDWQWSRQVGMNGKGVFPVAVSSDTAGNIFITGDTSANLLSCTNNTANCSGPSTGSTDVFILKFSSSGTWLSTKQLGAANKYASPHSMDIDSLGNVYVAGTTDAKLTSCLGVSSQCTGDSHGGNDYFILKYNALGEYQWVRQLGQSDKSFDAIHLMVSSANILYVSGSTTGNMPSCNGVSANCSGSAAGAYDYFITKYQ